MTDDKLGAFIKFLEILIFVGEYVRIGETEHDPTELLSVARDAQKYRALRNS